MDSCLPVFHLIDSQRSIPYAIKQIEHLLGISCAFEQAVQVKATDSLLLPNPICFIVLTNCFGSMHLLVGVDPLSDFPEHMVSAFYTYMQNKRDFNVSLYLTMLSCSHTC